MPTEQDIKRVNWMVDSATDLSNDERDTLRERLLHDVIRLGCTRQEFRDTHAASLKRARAEGFKAGKNDGKKDGDEEAKADGGEAVAGAGVEVEAGCEEAKHYSVDAERAFFSDVYRRGPADRMTRGDDTFETLMLATTDGEIVSEVRGLRSKHEPFLEHVVRALPKAGRIRYGHDKRFLKRAGEEKLFALDAPYVRLNNRVVSLIRVDIDAEFASEEAFRRELLEALDDDTSLLPFLAVGSIEYASVKEKGDKRDKRNQGGAQKTVVSFRNPHLYWLLDSPVCMTGNGRAGPRQLYTLAMRRLISRLADLGADPGCLSNPYHGKNPVWEGWDLVYVGSTTRSLQHLVDHLEDETDVDIEQLYRKAAEARARRYGVADAGQFSNVSFNVARKFAADNIAKFRARDDEKAARQEFRNAIAAHLHDACSSSSPAAARALETLADSTAEVWFRKDLSSHKARGAAGHLLTSDDDIKRRHAVGGRYAAGSRREKTIEKLVAAIRELRSEGEEITAAAVANRSGVSRRTVYRRLSDAVAAAGATGDADAQLFSIAADPAPAQAAAEEEIVPEAAAVPATAAPAAEGTVPEIAAVQDIPEPAADPEPEQVAEQAEQEEIDVIDDDDDGYYYVERLIVLEINDAWQAGAYDRLYELQRMQRNGVETIRVRCKRMSEAEKAELDADIPWLAA